MDKGPWKPYATDKGLCVASDDFTHDVLLYVSGDFADEGQRADYCAWLAGVLNKATPVQPSAATENPEAMYSPVAREGHAGASARQIDVAAGDQLVAGQPERCCLDYPRCDCNSPPEPDDDWLCFQRPAQPKVTP